MKVIIVVNGDGIITVESVESALKKPVLVGSDDLIPKLSPLLEWFKNVKCQPSKPYHVPTVSPKKESRERVGKSKFYYGDKVRITKTGKGMITLDKKLIGSTGTIRPQFTLKAKQDIDRECHLVLDNGEPLSFVFRDPISFVISDPNSHYFIENFVELISDKTELVKEKTIPFNIDLWRKGDFKKVVTRDGAEVSKLHDFGSGTLRLYGFMSKLKDGNPLSDVTGWPIDGRFSPTADSIRDLMLLIETTEQ